MLRTTFLTLGVVLGLGIVLLQAFPFTMRAGLSPQVIQPQEGYAYTAPFPRILKGRLDFLLLPTSDSNEAPKASNVRLLEQDAALSQPHSVHQDIVSLGAGRFSHWQDYLIFSASDNSDPRTNRRVYALDYPWAPPLWLAMLLALPGLVWLGNKRALRATGALITDPRWFGVFAVGLALFYNVIYWELLPAPVVAPDSGSYLRWLRIRTVGYPMLLDTYRTVSTDWRFLPLAQLNLMFVGLLTLAYAIGRLCKNFGLSLLLLALIHAGGQLLLYPAHMLTEGPFASFLMLHFGLVLLLLDKHTLTLACGSGLALAGVILIKSVGVVLLLPLALIASFTPSLRRIPLLAALLVPGFAAYTLPSVYNYARIGVFESSVIGGSALAGHVGWGIHPNGPSQYSELARRIETRLQPLLAQRPDRFSTLEEYTTYTANEYNPMLWLNIVPEAADYFNDACRLKQTEQCSWKACDRNNDCGLMINAALLSLARAAIVNHSADYAYHVFAHYYAMWRYLFVPRDFVQGIDDYVGLLPEIYAQDNRNWQRQLGFSEEQVMNFQTADAVREFRQSVGNRLVNTITFQSLLRQTAFAALAAFPQIMLGVSLLACILVFPLHRCSPIAAAFCYGGLVLNAYFTGHALAQVALDRYSLLMQAVAFATLLLGLALMFNRLKTVKRF